LGHTKNKVCPLDQVAATAAFLTSWDTLDTLFDEFKILLGMKDESYIQKSFGTVSGASTGV
jgi:hypothetical protein